MADSTEGDTLVQFLGLLISSLIPLMAGLVIHLFIIGVNVNDWWKGRSVTAVDHIVTSLGIVRICSLGGNALYLLVDAFYLRNLESYDPLAIIDLFFSFLMFANVWLTTLLSIVWCLKISTFRTKLFLYLKRMIVQRTVYFIAASVPLSAFSCFSLLSTIFSQLAKDGTYNSTIENVFLDCPNVKYIYNYAIGAFIPLIFYYISSVLLFASLYHHTTRMKISSNLTINLDTYYSLMKFVFFTFIYKTVYFIGHFVCVIYYYLYCVALFWLYILLDCLPILHSAYLIYRTANLRNQMSKSLRNVINFLFQSKDRETGKNIEVVAQ